jgi:hypothetical protein
MWEKGKHALATINLFLLIGPWVGDGVAIPAIMKAPDLREERAREDRSLRAYVTAGAIGC